jgi:hypothetical protein
MTQQTSIDTYNQIKAEGLLSKMRLKVLSKLVLIAPATASELADFIGYENGGRKAHSRLSELKDLGVIYEKCTRKCRITGRNVIEWDLTNRLPKALSQNKKPKQERLEKAFVALREVYKNKNDNDKWRKLADLIKLI